MHESAEIKNPIDPNALKWLYENKGKIYTNEKGLVTPEDSKTIEAIFLLYASICNVSQCCELAVALYEKSKTVSSKDEATQRIFDRNKQEARWFVDRLEYSKSYHPSQVRGTGGRLQHVVECLFGISIKRKDVVKTLCKNKEFKKELMKIITGDKP